MDRKLWIPSYAPGTPALIDFEALTVTQGLERSAKDFPGNTAINYMGKNVTYRQLNELVNRFCRALIDLGVKEKDKVAVILPNLVQTIVANMAIMRIGAVAVQNNPLYTERELAYQLNDSDSVMAITMTLLVPRILKIMPETKIKKIMGCHINSYLPFPKKQLFPYVKKTMYKKIETSDTVLMFEDVIGKYSPEPFEDKSKLDELGAIIYTGGTTGVSKGVMLSHRNLSCNVQQLDAVLPGIERGSVGCIGTFPIFHSAGFTVIQDYLIWRGFMTYYKYLPAKMIAYAHQCGVKFCPRVPDNKDLVAEYIRAGVDGFETDNIGFIRQCISEAGFEPPPIPII